MRIYVTSVFVDGREHRHEAGTKEGPPKRAFLCDRE